MSGSDPDPRWPGLNQGLGLKLTSVSHPPPPPDPWPQGGLGLAPLKTEGEALPYDRGAGPGRPLTLWEDLLCRLEAVRRRLRWLPHRLWWAAFGDEYY